MAMLDEIYNDGDVQGPLMDVPGFRFYPTEEELVGFYLRKKIQSDHPLIFDIIIPTLDLYRYDPWELPGLAHDVGEKQWFFFVPRVHGKSSSRPNRLTVSGFWKATGAERAVRNEVLQCIGLKKTLVFYKGKAPDSQKTDWIMNEYRLPNFNSSTTKKNMDMVLCRIYRKAVSWKSKEQRAKPNHAQKENPVFSAGDEYEDSPSNSFTVNGSFQLSNEMPETGFSSVHYDNQEGECSSDLSKRNDECNLFDCLEPIMCCEETMVLRNPKACKPPPLELPTLSMDCLFSSPSANNLSAWTPYALLSNP